MNRRNVIVIAAAVAFFLAAAIVALFAVLTTNLPSNSAAAEQSTDIVKIYDLFSKDQADAKRRFGQIPILVHGIIDHTVLTPNGAVVHLMHRNDDKAFRYVGDKIWVPFPVILDPKLKYDMGFEYRFDQFKRVIVPWHDREKITLLGILDFKDDGTITLIRAKLM
jgi:hypothetical protein